MIPWEVVGRVSTRHKSIPTGVVRGYDGCYATSAPYGRAGPVTFFASPKKVTQKRRPQGFAVFLRCSRQAGVAEIARRVARAMRDHASGLMLRRLDRLPLRSSGRIHGDPVELILDRFAIGSTGARMRTSGLLPWIGAVAYSVGVLRSLDHFNFDASSGANAAVTSCTAS